MGNCLSNCNDESFSPSCHWTPVTSGRLKKLERGKRKDPVKCFATRLHPNPMMEYLRLLTKASVLNIYDRFPLQLCYMRFVKNKDMPNLSIP